MSTRTKKTVEEGEHEIVTFLGNRVVIGPIDAYDSLKLDPRIAEFSKGVTDPETRVQIMLKVYTIGSIRSINGRHVNPRLNELEFQAVARQLDNTEIFQVMDKFADAYWTKTGDELKKESTTSTSSSSQP
jgi:hypothetical protein